MGGVAGIARREAGRIDRDRFGVQPLERESDIEVGDADITEEWLASFAEYVSERVTSDAAA